MRHPEGSSADAALDGRVLTDQANIHARFDAFALRPDYLEQEVQKLWVLKGLSADSGRITLRSKTFEAGNWSASRFSCFDLGSSFADSVAL
jgi:hypothetical protein